MGRGDELLSPGDQDEGPEDVDGAKRGQLPRLPQLPEVTKPGKGGGRADPTALLDYLLAP